MDQPATVGGYEILSKLGQGTTGVVYKARHPVIRPDRLLALKMPSLEPPSEAARRLAWYRCEYYSLAILTSQPDPAIPRLLNVALDLEGRNYYVREYVEGSTLDQRAAEGWLGLREGIGILSAIAAAVQHVHDRGLCTATWSRRMS